MAVEHYIITQHITQLPARTGHLTDALARGELPSEFRDEPDIFTNLSLQAIVLFFLYL